MTAGIYIHIPFCKQACHYCNFHFSTSLKNKTALLNAICKEIEQRRSEWIQHDFQSIYFGGGTPSLLSAEELSVITDLLFDTFQIEKSAEITLEANPDDLNVDYLNQLKANGINRLSIGIQSFRDEDLKYMNRAHNSKEALASIELAHKAGFEEISIDLIYGVPGMSLLDWEKNLEMASNLPVNHLSCYALTIEPKTALDHFIKKEIYQAPDDNLTADHFSALQNWASKMNWDHYEISNIAMNGKRALHNSSYWNGKPYVGFGPAAHSFDGKKTRRWNIANNAKYIRALNNNDSFSQSETLSKKDLFNERIMTSLRKKEGIAIEEIEALLIDSISLKIFQKAVQRLKQQNLITIENNYLLLSKEGQFLADHVISELFLTD